MKPKFEKIILVNGASSYGKSTLSTMLADASVGPAAPMRPTRRCIAVEVKNKGALAMRFLDRLKPEFSQGSEGLTPNEAFRTAQTGGSTTWALPT